jgi:hypothetical protein
MAKAYAAKHSFAGDAAQRGELFGDVVGEFG